MNGFLDRPELSPWRFQLDEANVRAGHDDDSVWYSYESWGDEFECQSALFFDFLYEFLFDLFFEHVGRLSFPH